MTTEMGYNKFLLITCALPQNSSGGGSCVCLCLMLFVVSASINFASDASYYSLRPILCRRFLSSLSL